MEFRQNLVTRLGAWSLENQGHENELVYQDIFPDLWTKLQSAFAEKQRSKIVGMARYLLDLKDFSRLKETQNVEMNESQQLAQRAYLGLQSKFQYGPISARESLIELAKSRYQS